MPKDRIEGFFDGVVAINITIMVLELKAPLGDTINALTPLIPIIFSYILSFLYIGIYWMNHHHMLHTCDRVTGSILWANLHLLFWLSLIPFATAWMGENQFTAIPTAVYGFVLLMCAIAYLILQRQIIVSEGDDSILKKAVGNDWKGKLSLGIYAISIILAFSWPQIAMTIYVLGALSWVIPDKRIERALMESASGQ